MDPQKSTLAWLRRRALEPSACAAPIVSWVVDPQRGLRPPSGVTHVVLDTPGGLHGFELARVLMLADAILMPVCDSAFDRDAAAQCWAALSAHPRVASGRCRVGVVGMRIDGRTRAEQSLQAWAGAIGAPFVGALRDTQGYVRCIERGLTIFDLPAARAQADRAQWAALLGWLDPLWSRPPEAAVPPPAEPREAPPAAAVRRVQARPAAARPVLEELAAALRPVAAPQPSALRRWLGEAGWPWGRRVAVR
jgi:chromosome partitioning protein